ncbi:MAG: hypothetical protein HYV62_00015 [Candidatus Rokubacteria bacterium]|nr:hypothetical protein [Candidatus Rokubacteria bacterium]
MATRDARFRQAAIAYVVYGILYMAGAIYLVSQGIGVRGMTGRAAGIVWFVLGTLFIVVFPWFIAKGAQRRGYLWFTRILTLLVAFRAFGVGQIALKPTIPSVPLPGGGEISMATGAWVFFLITLGTMVMLARAAWSRSP